jgi:hypothetical protein
MKLPCVSKILSKPRRVKNSRATGVEDFLSFFLSWVSKTQPNHWTKRMKICSAAERNWENGAGRRLLDPEVSPGVLSHAQQKRSMFVIFRFGTIGSITTYAVFPIQIQGTKRFQFRSFKHHGGDLSWMRQQELVKSGMDVLVTHAVTDWVTRLWGKHNVVTVKQAYWQHISSQDGASRIRELVKGGEGWA